MDISAQRLYPPTSSYSVRVHGECYEENKYRPWHLPCSMALDGGQRFCVFDHSKKSGGVRGDSLCLNAGSYIAVASLLSSVYLLLKRVTGLRMSEYEMKSPTARKFETPGLRLGSAC